MLKYLSIYLVVILAVFPACDQERDSVSLELELDYQPLSNGLFWIYAVDETIYFGENDSERKQYFYQDRVRTSYSNEENETVYIIRRNKSMDQVNWVLETEYTMIYRNKTLLRTINNKSIIALTFPPELGRIWNGLAYQAEGNDDFEIDQVEPSSMQGFEGVSTVRVNQQDFEDKITLRDIRYEIYGKGVGLLEKYDEVLTYCSRNNCLGQQLIDGGSKTQMKLIKYGAN